VLQGKGDEHQLNDAKNHRRYMTRAETALAAATGI